MTLFARMRAAGDQERTSSGRCDARPAREESQRAKKTAKAEKQDRKLQLEQIKADKQRTKAEQKQATQRFKGEQKQAKAEQKAREKGEYGRITPGNTKKIVGVMTVVGPTLAPFAARAAAGAREGYDRMRARQLGVPVDDLGRFTGKGAALHARIAGTADALEELRKRAASAGDSADAAAQAGTEKFVDSAEQRLDQLSSAVRAAERMPTGRRRAAHRSVAGELSRIEDDIMNRLGL